MPASSSVERSERRQYGRLQSAIAGSAFKGREQKSVRAIAFQTF
jgi:hypothetical protein